MPRDQDQRSPWSAHSNLHVAIAEDESLFEEAVEVWCEHLLVPESLSEQRTQIVHREHQDVWPVSRGSGTTGGCCRH